MYHFLCLLLIILTELVAPSYEKDKLKVSAISQCKCPTVTVKQWFPPSQKATFEKKSRFRHRRANDHLALVQSEPESGLCSRNLQNIIRDASRARNLWLSSEETMRNNLQDLKEKMEKLLSLNERAAAEAESQVHVHIFKIQGFKQRKQKGDIVSAVYYTNPHGYKFNSKVYLNGKGTATGTHVSLTVAVVNGEWDDILMWPITVNFTFSIMDQRETRDKYHFTRHANTTADHQQIEIQRPIGNGTNGEVEVVVANLEKFALHSDLIDAKDLYTLKDTLFLKIKIVIKKEED